VSKKFIIITSGLGLLSFVGAFSFAFLLNPPQKIHPNDALQSNNTIMETEPKIRQANFSTKEVLDTSSSITTKSMTEQQLKNLIHDLRRKMQDYDNKLQSLKVEEQRLQTAQNILREDLEKLHSLQIELASITANLKSEHEKLLKTRIEIDKNEQSNLVLIAATYDKMDATSASKIMTNMCLSNAPITGQDKQNSASFEDAVKILYFMTERTKAKLLAELATSEPQLAAVLSQRLKQIVEVN
jgi:chromosome segregation ATPase